MAVAAVDSVIAYVVFVAELHGLRARYIGLGNVRRPIDFNQNPDEEPDDKETAKDAESRYRISARVKYLGHLRRFWGLSTVGRGAYHKS